MQRNRQKVVLIRKEVRHLKGGGRMESKNFVTKFQSQGRVWTPLVPSFAELKTVGSESIKIFNSQLRWHQNDNSNRSFMRLLLQFYQKLPQCDFFCFLFLLFLNLWVSHTCCYEFWFRNINFWWLDAMKCKRSILSDFL